VPVWFLLLGVVVGARYAPLAQAVRGNVDAWPRRCSS